MGDRTYRQPFHARKGKGMQQPTPLTRVKAGNKNIAKVGGDVTTSGRNRADSQQGGGVHKYWNANVPKLSDY